MMSLKEKIEVMEAFHAGKAIEWRWVGEIGEWMVTEKPLWNFADCNYRVKPDDKPLTRKDLAMNYDQMIEVLQAAKDGKAIQMRSKVNRRTGGAWHDVTDPLWDFAACNYRVKPEPRVFYAVLREHGSQCVAYRDRKLAEKLADPPDYKVVKLVEVLDDSMEAPM
jgi:hypothetical protein